MQIVVDVPKEAYENVIKGIIGGTVLINGCVVANLKDSIPFRPQGRRINCESAEHDGNGCLGYSHYDDDFPIEECLHCPKYTSYEEE